MAKDYGFRVSLPGYNVLSCQDKNLVVTSKAPCLKIVELGEVGFQYGSAISPIPHNVPLPFLAKIYWYSSSVDGWREIFSFNFDSSNINIESTGVTENDINPILRYFILYG